MIYLLYGLFILTCVVLVVSVLLQPGKADAGALFTSSVSSTAFGPRGTQTLLAKITIGAAALFMLLALTLSLTGLTGTRSVVEDGDVEVVPQTQPAPQQQQQPPQQQEGAAPTSNANGNPAETTTQPAPAANTNADR